MATLRDDTLHVSVLELSAIQRIDAAVAFSVSSGGATREQLHPIYRNALIALFGAALVQEFAGREVWLVCDELGPQHCGAMHVVPSTEVH